MVNQNHIIDLWLRREEELKLPHFLVKSYLWSINYISQYFNVRLRVTFWIYCYLPLIHISVFGYVQYGKISLKDPNAYATLHNESH